MPERSSIFDMIGPIMIGPSSSHTAGVVRIGLAARHIFGEQPEVAHITFYNSFATTYEGHGSDRAIIAGLLGFATDDERIKNALEYAKEANLTYHFKGVANAGIYHPNTIKLNLEKQGKTLEIIGVSRGGGLIAIREIDGFTCNLSGQYPTLIIDAADVKGSIAFIASIIANDGVNIGTMSVNRTAKNGTAKLFIEMDSEIKPIALEYMRHLSWVHEVKFIPVVA
ncbi:MAG: L-serine ammonia-lyase, iron-sulfur-dependent subunit beta [Bacteroidia bacterium]|nr:L-serine ammonia-lyase, iron-sulfur-dependent subunit beta [Bacteroidia bacterium]